MTGSMGHVVHVGCTIIDRVKSGTDMVHLVAIPVYLSFPLQAYHLPTTTTTTTTLTRDHPRETPDDLHRRNPKGQPVDPTDTGWRSTLLGWFPIWGIRDSEASYSTYVG